MNTRANFFAQIDAATDAVSDKIALPDYDVSLTHSLPKLDGTDLWEIFCRNFKAVNGRPMVSVAELIAFLQESKQVHGYCDPDLMDSVGSQLVAAGLSVETEYDRNRYDDYQFGITRATGAIAESGTLILDDDRTSRRLAALTPWVHVAVIQSAEIHRCISDALNALGHCSNIIWCTGPSKTADVEGILIEGVHGPGEQIALRV
jgi:L-lactate dehydrogenase complex protein LldG